MPNPATSTNKPGPKHAGDKVKGGQHRALVRHIADKLQAMREAGTFRKGMIKEEVDAHNDNIIPAKRTLNRNQVQKRMDYLAKTKAKKAALREAAAEAAAASAASDATLSTAASSTPPKKHAGRPKGTTKAELQFKKEVISSFKDEVTKQYRDYRQLRDWAHERDKPNFRRQFDNIKDDIAAQYIADGYEFIVEVQKNYSERTANSRILSNNFENVQRGAKSPVADMEFLLVQMLIQATRANASLSMQETIDLANGLVDEGPGRDEAIAKKYRLVHSYRRKYEELGTYPTKIELGKAWFSAFINRFEGELEFAKHTLVERSRETWCNYHKNVRDMYDKLYSYWLMAGYIEPLPNGPEHQDIFGNKVDRDDPTRVGRLVKYRWKYPDRMLLADEVGYNTNIARGKANSYDKAVCEAGSRPAKAAATDDCHYTSMCFTTIEGDPVLFVLIVPSSYSFNANLILGVDVTADWIGDTSYFDDNTPIPAAAIKENTGEGKRFNGGVTCNFKGKEIPMLVLQSNKASNLSVLLREIVRYMDKLEIFERRNDLPPPALLLDGHGSRFGIEFLTYVANKDLQCNPIKDANHEWNVYMGLPNCTGVWQVGDSSEQNGMFKNKLREKASLIQTEQRQSSVEVRIGEEHIVPMVQYAFPHSFGNVRTNKIAIAERGWGPLNRNCLYHPKVRYKRGGHVYDSDNESVPDNYPEAEASTPAASSVSTLTRGSLSDLSGSTNASIRTSTSSQTDGVADSLRRLNRQRSEKKSKSARGLELKPMIVDMVGVSCHSSMNLRNFLEQSDNRVKRQEEAFLKRRKQAYDQRQLNSEQVKQTQKVRVGAGAEQKKGNYMISAPSLLKSVARMKNESDKADFEKSMRLYAKRKKRYELGLALLKRGPDKRKGGWTSAELETLIKFKRLGIAPSDLKGKPIPTGKAGRCHAWERTYQPLSNPMPQPKPEGYDGYAETQYNLNVVEIRFKAFGLPWNERTTSIKRFKSDRENSDDFDLPSLEEDEIVDVGDQPTSADFATYGAEIFTSEWTLGEDVAERVEI